MDFIGAKESYRDVKNTLWTNYDKNINHVGRYIDVNNITKKTIGKFETADEEWHYGIRTTASTESTKKNNIYDLDGNLWEWTKETYKKESNIPMVYYGFRPVLYMK